MAEIQWPTDDHVPLDLARIDRLMAAAGLDVLVGTSKHNAQYLLDSFPAGRPSRSPEKPSPGRVSCPAQS